MSCVCSKGIKITNFMSNPELTYVLSLIEFRELTIALEHEMFNTMDHLEYELKLISVLKEKCKVVIKDYV